MAKQKQTAAPSWDDFSEDSLMGVNLDEETEETQEEEQENEEEGEEEKPRKKVKASKSEEESEEEVEQEEEEEKPLKKKNKKEEESEEETEEESTEEGEEESEEEEADPLKFFEEVEKLTGQELEVEYGDVDPLSPQGVALREKAVKEAAVDSFLEEIEANYPAAYKALQHAYNGGDIAELFKTTTSRDYSKVTLTENDKPLAQEILKEYYQSKGVKNESRIKKMLQEAEDSEEGLINDAKAALEEMKAEQAERADEALKTQKAKSDEQRKKDQLMISAVDEVLESGKLGTFKLAGRQEASEFKNFALKSIKKTADGRYEFSTPIDSSNLEKLLQYQYFQFKKGDLSKLIQIKAATENAKNLRLKLKAEAGKGKKGTGTSEVKQEQSIKDFEV